jgi:large subunit ribosomal protein L13
MSYTAGTYTAKRGDNTKNWLVINAENIVLGRLAAEIAKFLRGKHKARYSPSLDSGDNVVVINAGKVQVTGKKKENKKFFWHTGHPGGVKERTIGERLSSKFPERVLLKSVERMMPKDSPLARQQMKALHVYASAEHPHEAQKPKTVDIANKNRKNTRGKVSNG